MSFFEELRRRNVIRVGIAYGVASWLLLQIADLVMDNIEAPAWIMHVMMLFVGLGFVVSLVIAWAYEMTPEGIKREADVVREESVTHYTAKKLNFITLGAIVLLIALLLADRFMPAGSELLSPAPTVVETESVNDVAESDSADFTQLTRGVAVLPFANLSEDPNNAFFAGGVHEDILTNLSRIADLRVISRTSMLKVAEQGLGIQEIGLQLDVSHVLEGSVRRAGDQVRVTVQLIDASNDDHLWADNYDRKLEDIFAIQSEIAQKIATQLETELSPEQAERLAEVPTQNTRAYDLFLKARELRRTWLGVDGFKQMLPLLEQAVALDPNFLDAQVILAATYGRLVWFSADTDGIYRANARAVTDRILQQWPDRPESDIAQGNFHYTVERDYQQALFSYQKALPFMPNNTDLLIAIASSYKRLAQFALGLPVITLAESLDPAHPQIAAEIIFHLVGTGQYEEALDHARDASAKFPDDITVQISLARYSLLIFGNKDEFISIMDSVKNKSPQLILSSPWQVRMLTNGENIDQQIDWINQSRGEADFLTEVSIDTQIAELLNLADREDESRQMARTVLGSVNERLAQGLPLGGSMPEADYANFAYLACLANDTEAFDRYTTMAESMTSSSSEGKLAKDQSLALATAECGDVETLWKWTMTYVRTNPYFGVTKWQLALDPLYQHYFANIPEYQQMVQSLQNNKNGSQ